MTERLKLIYKNEVKSYLPRITEKEFVYILREHTTWPELKAENAPREIARYMDRMGIKRVGKTSSTKPAGK